MPIYEWLTDLITEVALGGLGVGVQDKGVGDLEAGRHLHVHPRRSTYQSASVMR